ncbi:hypothetical protein [Butyrivibrio proteoclasticus]|uniref:hypothetical protein n=1 Tax=Butyrivibrio proteoclasticus TaxID=43305 RepID=UPI000479CBAD|nr:hypothetical protein [Butyrivibrio proteoclasticus]
MKGFKTKNSMYLVNNNKKEITGGVLGDNWYTFESATILVGMSANILLTDGRKLTTSTVESYL